MLKKIVLRLLKRLNVDNIYRYLNRHKILIIAYHGVSENSYEKLPWTHIPVDIFEEQICFFKKYYQVISLKAIIECIRNKKMLPDRSVAVTFDDGYKNNYKVAMPILKKYEVPATIFLTTGYIGRQKYLPMDRAFLTLFFATNRDPLKLPGSDLQPLHFDCYDAIIESYNSLVAFLKKFSTKKQEEYLELLNRQLLPVEYQANSQIMDDFLLMDWEDVFESSSSCLIDYGAHTVSHEILSNLSETDAEKEILQSKNGIEDKVKDIVNLFAYPNGTLSDFSDEHIQLLKKHGFYGAVSTMSRLNSLTEDPFYLARMCIGSDISSDLDFLALRTSGFLNHMAELKIRLGTR